MRRPRPLAARAVRWAALALLAAGCSRPGAEPDRPGEMVLRAATGRVRGFDPARVGDVTSSLAISRVYEGLLQYAYLERPYRLEPLLAEAMPEVSEDGLTYTFRVRRGIHFQDDPCFTATGGRGRELTAGDFVYAIKRVADLKNQSSGYWAFNRRIVGLDAFREVSGGPEPTEYDRPVAGLEAVDDHTLRVVLTEPYPQLLYILSMHYAFAVPREAVAYYGDDFVNRPVGTGPYVLAEWRRNYRMVFVRNPKWAETGRIERYPERGAPGDPEAGLIEDAGRPVPFVDRVVLSVVQDPSTQWLMFLTGQFGTSGISRDNWDAVVGEHRGLRAVLATRGVELSTAPTMTLNYVGFNMGDPVVGTNRKLRQAMTCAFNTEAWIRHNHGRIIRPTGPIPPGVSGYAERPARFPFDLARARALLAEAGYPGGVDPATGRRLQLTLELGSAESAEVRESVDLLKTFMDEIGVVLRPSYNHGPAFFDKLARRQAQVFRLGWVADYPDAENFLQLFYGPNRSPGPNHANYENPEFDRLYERLRTLTDSPERTALCQEMAALVEEDCPFIFDSIPLAYGLRHRWVRNHKHHDFPYGMGKYVRIDAADRQAWMDEPGRRERGR